MELSNIPRSIGHVLGFLSVVVTKMNLIRAGSRTSVPDDYPFSEDRQTRGTRLPSSILVAIRPRFLPSHRHNGQLVRWACIGVYRPIGTAAGVLLPFVIYAALSSAPQQRSYSFDRSNPSVVYISLPLFSLLLPPLFESLALDIVIRYRCSSASNRRAGSTRDRVLPLFSSLFTSSEYCLLHRSMPRHATPTLLPRRSTRRGTA